MKLKDKFIKTKDLAERWGLHEGTLRNWRAQKKGPPYYKTGKDVVYKLSDITKHEKTMMKLVKF